MAEKKVLEVAEEIKATEVVEAPTAVEVIEEKPAETAIAVKEEVPTLPTQFTPNQLPAESRTMWNDPAMMKQSMQMAKALSQAPMVPNGYRGQPGNCLIAIDYATRMNVSPLTVMQMLDIIQGNPGWRGQAAIALVNNHGRFEPIKFEITHNEDWSEFSCFAYAKEKATGQVLKGTTVDHKMAKACGWLDKNGTYWKKMPEQMCQYRAAAYFARAYAPEALMGLYFADEQADITGNYGQQAEAKTFQIRKEG